jgi:hypothetical protein
MPRNLWTLRSTPQPSLQYTAQSGLWRQTDGERSHRESPDALQYTGAQRLTQTRPPKTPQTTQ